LRYNVAYYYSDEVDINNRDILSAIIEVNETLSIANSPKLVLEMTLETLSNVLEVESSWIQIADAAKNLELAAYHGFHFKEQLEIIVQDVTSVYQKEVVGLGNSIIIPNLHRHNKYNLSALSRMGYAWLVAVPIRNHRLAGVMSITSRKKKKLDNDFSDLMYVIAGLVIMAAEKCAQKLNESIQQEVVMSNEKDKQTVVVDINELFGLHSNFSNKDASPAEPETCKENMRTDSQGHNRSMSLFRMKHR
jgi:hypothetical protein